MKDFKSSQNAGCRCYCFAKTKNEATAKTHSMRPSVCSTGTPRLHVLKRKMKPLQPLTLRSTKVTFTTIKPMNLDPAQSYGSFNSCRLVKYKYEKRSCGTSPLTSMHPTASPEGPAPTHGVLMRSKLRRSRALCLGRRTQKDRRF